MSKVTFVLSDIHGCRKEMNLLLSKILKRFNSPNFIFLGDYVDRGKDSKGVVDDLLQLRNNYECVFLIGNHEDMLLDRAKGINAFGNRWDKNGNDATIFSYGSLSNILKIHGDFYENLNLYYEEKDFLFVHGGLEPNLSLEEQDYQTMLWIRDDFIYSDYDFGKIIIYGHTPQFPIRITFKKICVDTGCVYGKNLTALKLDDFSYFTVPLGGSKIDSGRLDRNALLENNITL